MVTCSSFGSPYGNKRALPLIFPFPSFIFPFTSCFLLQQHNVRSALPFTRVDPWLLSPSLTPPHLLSTVNRFRFRNFLSSFSSVFFDSWVFIGGYGSEWPLLRLRSTFLISLLRRPVARLNKGINVSDLLPLCTRARLNPRADISDVSITALYPACPLLRRLTFVTRL